MIFNSGWSKKEIEELTYAELFDLVDLFYKQHYEKMFDFFKLFCISNAESTAVAGSDKPNALREYAEDIRRRQIDAPDEGQEADLDQQFEEGLENG